MSDESAHDLLIRAEAAFDGVVGDPVQYGPEAQRLVGLARRGGHPEPLVVALRACAWYERSTLANARARALLDEAVRLARRAGLHARIGEVLITRSAVLQELGDTGAALADLERADDFVDEASRPDLEHKRATLLQNTGRLGEAADAYHRILAHPDSTPARASAAANNLALIESMRGRPDNAFRYMDRAAALAPAVGPVRVAFVAHNRALVLAQTGRLAESLRQFEEAARLLAASGLPLGEFQFEQADALLELGLVPEARALAMQAAEDLDRHDVPLMAAEAWLRVARTALLAGDSTEAVEAARRARDEFRRHRRPAWTARATIVAAEAAGRRGTATEAVMRQAVRAAAVLGRGGVQAGAVDAALVTGRLALALDRRTVAERWLKEAHRRSRGGPMLVRLRGGLAAALVARLNGDERDLMVRCRAGLVDLARHRAAFGSVELRALAAGHGIELGLLGLGSLLRTGSPSRVLDWVERTRAAALLTVEPPAPDIVREERAELAAIQTELVTARRETGAEPGELLARQTALEHRIRRATWHRAGSGVVSGAAIRTGHLVGLLDGRALVSYGRFDDEMFAVVLHGGRRRLVRLGAWDPVRFEGDAAQFALRRLTRPGPAAAIASARASAQHSLARLAELLVRPLGIPSDSPLVVIPARDTHRLPWSALQPAPVEVAPSATLWAATRTRPVDDAGRVVVVAGPGLAGAEREVDAVAACHPRPTVLAPPKSTAAAVLDAIGAADLVHLACHGLLRADNPMFSALELTDGRLTVHELDLRGIAPRRVVLAACDSAADVAYAGDELLGFVSALLARGTAGVVASAVAVGDVEAVPLMRALHERIAAGDSLAVALHGARASIDLDDPRAFVNWCAFTAYGAG